MITSVTLKNYKAHRDTTIELGRFTVLVGPNGSGKTSVLEAIDRADCAGAWGYPEQLFPSKAGQPRAYHRGGSGPLEITFTTTAGLGGRTKTVAWASSKGWVLQAVGPEGPESPRSRGATFYRFEARLIASPSESRQERPFLEPDGRNAGDVIAALKLADDPALERIETTLRKVVPGVSRILIQRREIGDSFTPRPPGAESIVGQQIVLDFDNAPDVSAEDVSEGTLVTLALITAICSGPRPHTLLLDDLGLSLHPTAQMELVRQLHRLLQETPDIQILATTHSPYILDEMKPEDVVVLAQKPDGSVASKRLSEHPESAKMKGMLGAGQIWSLDPEQRWVAGGV